MGTEYYHSGQCIECGNDVTIKIPYHFPNLCSEKCSEEYVKSEVDKFTDFEQDILMQFKIWLYEFRKKLNSPHYCYSMKSTREHRRKFSRGVPSVVEAIKKFVYLGII